MINDLSDDLTKTSLETLKNSKNPDVFAPFTGKGKGSFDPLLVKLALGNLVIVGDQIAYLQRVQIQTNASASKSGPSITLSHTTGFPGDQITITGANFGATQGKSTVTFGTTSVATIAASDWSDQSINVTVPPSLQPGDVKVVVSVGGTDSAPATFTVFNPALRPTISLKTTSAAAKTADLPLTVNGSNFVKDVSTVMWTPAGGSATKLPTTFVSATQLTAVVPASDLATAGTANVTVDNGAPGGASNAIPFTIN